MKEKGGGARTSVLREAGALQRAHHSAHQIVHRQQSAPSIVELLVQPHLVRYGERGLLGNERDVTDCRMVVCRGARRLQTRDGLRVCAKQTWGHGGGGAEREAS